MTVGDYDLRGLDFETILVGAVNEAIIDADRRVRLRWDNGFPNWAMYRCAYAGDAHLRRVVRDWCVAYAIAHCEAGGVRAGLPAEEIGCLAGWDAYYALLNHKWVIAGVDIADVAGVDPKTYRKVRNRVYAVMAGSLREYWNLMQIEIREAARANRLIGQGHTVGGWRPLAEGEGAVTVASHSDGNGNYWMKMHRSIE